MANQVTGVTITPDAGGSTCTIQIGPNSFGGIQVTSLFDRGTFDASHLFGNIRLRHVIGNYGELFSKEFLDAINASGIATTAGDFYAVSFAANPDGSVTVAFGTEVGGAANQTITCNPLDLSDDTHDLSMVVKNVGAFLRKAGFHDLTTPAASGLFVGKTASQATALQTFRY